jgi:hypothetical protein
MAIAKMNISSTLSHAFMAFKLLIFYPSPVSALPCQHHFTAFKEIKKVIVKTEELM